MQATFGALRSTGIRITAVRLAVTFFVNTAKLQKPIRITTVFKAIFCRPYFAKPMLVAVLCSTLVSLSKFGTVSGIDNSLKKKPSNLLRIDGLDNYSSSLMISNLFIVVTVTRCSGVNPNLSSQSPLSLITGTVVSLQRLILMSG